jgi:hypothetical protein
VVSSVEGAPLAFLYENPQWLIPIFAEFARRKIGYDSVALIQEFVPARGGYITRVETLGGRYLYAIRVHLSGLSASGRADSGHRAHCCPCR